MIGRLAGLSQSGFSDCRLGRVSAGCSCFRPSRFICRFCNK